MSQQPPQEPSQQSDSQHWGPPAPPGAEPYGGQQLPPAAPPAVPTFLKNIPSQLWARALLIPLMFFGGSLLMAAITAAFGSSLLGSLVAEVGADFGQLFHTGSSWIVLTFQLLSMGFLAPLAIGIEVAGFGMSAAPGTLFFVPWLVPAGGMAAVFATQRFLGGNLRVPTTGIRFMLAGMAGLIFATVITVLASAVRFRFDAGFIEGGVWAHSAAFPGFIVSALLVGLITYLLFLPQRGVVLQRSILGMTAVVEHVVALAALAAVALVITALVMGESEIALVALFAMPTLGLFAFSMLHFIPIVASGSENAGIPVGESVTMFDLPTPAWIIGIIVMLAAIFVSAFRWSLRTRLYAQAIWSWITLPATYLLTGVLFVAANGLYVSVFMAGEGIRVSVVSAIWGFLVWLLLGAIIQALAVYLMPGLVRRMPAGLVRTLGIGLALPPTAAAAAMPMSPVPANMPPPPPAAIQAEQAVEQTAVFPAVPDSDAHERWATTAPVEREPRAMTRKTKVVLFSGLGVLVLAAIIWVAYTAFARTVFGPQHTADSYLQAVVDGRAEDALQAMGPNVTDEQRVLATNEVYQAAKNRPDRFEIGEVNRDGSDAVVEATVFQAGKAYPLELGLSTSGTQAVVFPDWELETGDLAGWAVYLSGPAQLTINEVEIEVDPAGQQTDSSAEFSGEPLEGTGMENLVAEAGQVLLPGTYTFTAPQGSEYLSNGEDLELTITPGEVSTTPIEFSQRYTEAFATDAVAHIEQRLESCLADATIRIEDCEAASWEDTSWNAMTDMQRTWEQTPTVELVPTGADPGLDADAALTDYSGLVTARIVEGSINLTYQVRDEADDDWMDRERIYEPFEVGFFEPMELPVTLDGDEINIDYSALDEYNPDWLSPEFRD